MPIEALAELGQDARRDQEVAAQIRVLSTEIQDRFGGLLALDYDLPKLEPLIEHAKDPGDHRARQRRRPGPLFAALLAELPANLIHLFGGVTKPTKVVAQSSDPAAFFELPESHRRQTEPPSRPRTRQILRK